MKILFYRLTAGKLIFFLCVVSARAQSPFPIVRKSGKDSSLVTFIYKDVPGIKKLRLVSELIPYFDNGINIKPEKTGWLTKNNAEGNWQLTLTLDNRLRIPYRYELTVDKNGKDSVFETIDPLNTYTYLKGNKQLEQSVLELEKAYPFPWSNIDTTSYWKKASLASSVTSKPCDIYVYTPPAFSSASKNKYPLVIGVSSFSYGIEMPAAAIYQSLLKQKKVRPAVMALIDYKSYNSVADFDSCALLIVKDVLPYLEAHFNVSTMAKDITITGISRRGVASSYIALSNDQFIGNVISLSGGFSWRENRNYEYEWLSTFLASSPKKNVNFYLSAGNLETVVTNNNSGHYLLATNRHFRNILHAKNYTYKYEEIPGGHNPMCWAHGFYNGLAYILKK